jgi:hypothetical protein
MSRKYYSVKGAQDWPAQADQLDTAQVIELYNRGFAGAYHEPEARAELLHSMARPNGEAVAYEFNLAGSGEGKLSLPYIFAYKQWPTAWPGPGQTTGDCVSQAGSICSVILMGVEVALQTVDPITGVIEGFPELTSAGIENGVVATEPQYGARGHSGQGANCSTLQNWMMTKGGVILRKSYPDLNIDFTTYNSRVGANWGGRGTPQNITAEGKKHQIRAATDCPKHEIVRDFIANGYPVWVCSGLGWSDKRDVNGYSKRSGSWSHSWVVIGYDDRDIIKEKYGFPLFHYCHRWGRWNSGGTRILGTIVDIPEGTFWADARLLDNCECTAMSNLNGWPRQDIPDFLVV